jgi:glycosyltransferase involved in cell wall biosynthesis
VPDAPTLAMLIPAYNAAGFLPRLLASAAVQSQPFDEIWVYDDCSTDDTASVAERLGARVVRGDIKRGCSHGKNVLVHKTRCDWVHFHDADDDLKPNFMSFARRWALEDRFDVVLFAYEELDDESEAHIAFRRFDPFDLGRDARSFAVRNQINPFCGLYRREALIAAGGYDEDPCVLFNEDVAMHIGLAFAGLSFAAETEVSIINRRRRDSMSSASRLRCVQAQFEVMRKTSMRPNAEVYRKEIAKKLWGIAGVAASLLDWKTADAAASLAMRLGGPGRASATSTFRALCHISPRLALRVREASIRMFRPETRAGYPGWLARSS